MDTSLWWVLSPRCSSFDLVDPQEAETLIGSSLKFLEPVKHYGRSFHLSWPNTISRWNYDQAGREILACILRRQVL
jgi:hypothetical protein